MVESRPSRADDMEEFQRLLKEYIVTRSDVSKEKVIAYTRSLRDRRSLVVEQCATALCVFLYEHGDSDAIYVATFMSNETRAQRLRASLRRRESKGIPTKKPRATYPIPHTPVELKRAISRPVTVTPLPSQYERHKDLLKRKTEWFITQFKNLMARRS